MTDAKISIKQAQISVSRFNAAVNDYLETLRKHRVNIQRWLPLNDWDQIKREEIKAANTIKQITNTLNDMDKLRERVQADDVQRYDELMAAGRQRALKGIDEYTTLKLRLPRPAGFDDEAGSSMESTLPRIGNAMAPQLQVQQLDVNFDKDKYELARRQAGLEEVEQLQHQIVDLYETFRVTQTLVHEQAPAVETLVEAAQMAEEDVRAGERQLRRAVIAKRAGYPILGALIGTCLAGPIGLVAGIKVGGLAAVGCGLLGYTGGSALKAANPVQGNIEEQQELDELPNTGVAAATPSGLKQD